MPLHVGFYSIKQKSYWAVTQKVWFLGFFWIDIIMFFRNFLCFYITILKILNVYVDENFCPRSAPLLQNAANFVSFKNNFELES